MFPVPRSPRILNEPRPGADESHLSVVEQGAGPEDARIVAYPTDDADGALRIGAALRAAHQDNLKWQSADGKRHEWSWTVKALPKPPLVLVTNEQLNSEDLLANDSLGG